MNDDELTRRLAETLRAKAGQVPESTEAFDPSARVTELDASSAKPGRGAWRYALVSAALIALVAGIIAAVVAVTSDDRPDTAGPGPNTTIETPSTIAPSTTAPTSTTLPAATTTTPTPTTTVPPVDERTLPVEEFNRYIESLPRPSDATDARALALTFTHNSPPPTEPKDALRVEERSLPDNQHEVVVFVKLADDSTAEARYRLVFTLHSDGSWRLLSAADSHRCQLGRGHQEFTTASCI
jgi:hypothetical protein